MTTKLIPIALKALTRDGWLLFFTRFERLFAYGSLSVILVFYLIGLGLTEAQSGLVLTLTLAGDVVVSLLLTTQADRIGRRRMLIIGAILMAAAGLAFASTRNLLFLDPRGNDRGHQSERQRSRTISLDRASRPVAHRSGPRPDGSFRVVHTGRFPGHGAWRAMRWFPHTGAATVAHVHDSCCELSRGGPSVCRAGVVAGISLHAVYPNWWRWVRLPTALRTVEPALPMFSE